MSNFPSESDPGANLTEYHKHREILKEMCGHERRVLISNTF